MSLLLIGTLVCALLIITPVVLAGIVIGLRDAMRSRY